MPILGSDTIQLLPPIYTFDARDNSRITTYGSSGIEVKKCSVQPFLMTEKFQEEFTVERETTRTFFRVFAPYNSDTLAITPEYGMLFQGDFYEVHALSGRWRDFGGTPNHIAFLCKRRLG